MYICYILYISNILTYTNVTEKQAMWTFLSDGWIYTAMVLWLALNPFTPCGEIWHL